MTLNKLLWAEVMQGKESANIVIFDTSNTRCSTMTEILVRGHDAMDRGANEVKLSVFGSSINQPENMIRRSAPLCLRAATKLDTKLKLNTQCIPLSSPH